MFHVQRKYKYVDCCCCRCCQSRSAHPGLTNRALLYIQPIGNVQQKQSRKKKEIGKQDNSNSKKIKENSRKNKPFQVKATNFHLATFFPNCLITFFSIPSRYTNQLLSLPFLDLVSVFFFLKVNEKKMYEGVEFAPNMQCRHM